MADNEEEYIEPDPAKELRLPPIVVDHDAVRMDVAPSGISEKRIAQMKEEVEKIRPKLARRDAQYPHAPVRRYRLR